MTDSNLQENQPPGVPPLPLTGERTLPDVPEENYCFAAPRVYESIAERVPRWHSRRPRLRRGYGSDVLAERAAEVVGVDATRSQRACPLRYRRPNLRFERTLVEGFDERCDAIVFLQTIEHIADTGALLARFSELAPAAYVSTPNRLTLPRGRGEVRQPVTCASTPPRVPRAVTPHFESVELWGVFHAGRLSLHEHALRLGWDRVHPRSG